MLITEVKLTITAGAGGSGFAAFDVKDDNSPDGGDGGSGGDVYIIGTNDIHALNNYVTNNKLAAGDGKSGQPLKRPGLGGADLILNFPIGTLLHDEQSGFVYRVENARDKIKIAKGGRGGRGNFSFRYYKKFSKHYFEKGLPGTVRNFFAELKLVADFGFVGMPNAGKSSLLNELSATHFKVANYPFTTLEPNIANFGDKVVADIPGLIEGASEGKGLGSKFLKHVENIGLLIHCVPADSQDLAHEYEAVCEEIKQFNPIVAKKKKLILLTKSDLVTPEVLDKQVTTLKKYELEVLPVSIHDWDLLEALKSRLMQ